jgi:hypothetical protein
LGIVGVQDEMVVERWPEDTCGLPNRSLGDYLEMTMQLSHGWLANARCNYSSADPQITVPGAACLHVLDILALHLQKTVHCIVGIIVYSKMSHVPDG